MIVSFVVVALFGTVVADAGVFEVVTGGTFLEVEVEADGLRFGIRGDLHLYDDGDVVSGGEGFVGNEDAIF